MRFNAPSPFATITSIAFLAFCTRCSFGDWRLAPWPKDKALEAVTAQMRTGNEDETSRAEKQIHLWLGNHLVMWNLYGEWFPIMAQRHEYQNIADLSLAAIISKPAPDIISDLLTWRIRALLALKRPQEALAAAKSFFNACDWSKSEYAVKLVGLCLSQCHPNDPDIGRRFLIEQSLASVSLMQITDGSVPHSASLPSATATLKSIRIDESLYEDGISEWSTRDGFWDRVNYGTILLVADRCDDAEKEFRDLYTLAQTQDEIDAAYQGILHSIRAQDGTLARANAWLEQSHPTTSPIK